MIEFFKKSKCWLDRQMTKAERLLASARVRYILYFLLALAAGLFHDLSNQDELWNYNFASCMANGLLPYRDFNLLQTPFSCLVNGVALTIFGHHLVVIRLTGVALFTLIAIECDRITRILRPEGSLVTPFLGVAFVDMFFWNVFLEYCGTIQLCALVAMRCDLATLRQKQELQGRGPWFVRQILVGVLLGCGMMSKQTYGTFMAICAWVTCLYVQTVTSGHWKKGFLAMFWRMVGTSIPCFIFLFYLLGTGTFADFWDMCFYGISNFSAHYAYTSFLMDNPGFFLFGLLLPFLLALAPIVAIRHWKTERARLILVIWLFSIAGLINIVPLANSYHVAVVSVSILFLIFLVFPEKWFSAFFIRLACTCFLIGSLAYLCIINPAINIWQNDAVTGVKGLELTIDPPEKQEDMKTIMAYVEEQNAKGTTVYILDNFAPLYFMPSGQYHKYFDMFLNGNIGTITPYEVLESAEVGCLFLLPDSDRKNFQMPETEMKEYMKKCTEVGRVCDFTVYRK